MILITNKFQLGQQNMDSIHLKFRTYISYIVKNESLPLSIKYFWYLIGMILFILVSTESGITNKITVEVGECRTNLNCENRFRMPINLDLTDLILIVLTLDWKITENRLTFLCHLISELRWIFCGGSMIGLTLHVVHRQFRCEHWVTSNYPRLIWSSGVRNN